MTDPRDFEPDEPLGRWFVGIGAAALIGYLIIVTYSNTTSTESTQYATANVPPRIAPSNPVSGAQPEQPSQFKPGGLGQ
jgi:hypothetical protein